MWRKAIRITWCTEQNYRCTTKNSFCTKRMAPPYCMVFGRFGNGRRRKLVGAMAATAAFAGRARLGGRRTGTTTGNCTVGPAEQGAANSRTEYSGTVWDGASWWKIVNVASGGERMRTSKQEEGKVPTTEDCCYGRCTRTSVNIRPGGAGDGVGPCPYYVYIL